MFRPITDVSELPEEGFVYLTQVCREEGKPSRLLPCTVDTLTRYSKRGDAPPLRMYFGKKQIGAAALRAYVLGEDWKALA